MLNINSIAQGIVIDHIKPGSGFFIFKYLGLHEADYTVALIMNAKSKKYGRKDMIKIENILELDLKALGFIDPDLTINIIEGEEIKEKICLELPDEIENIIKYTNPRCITSIENHIVHKFILIDREEQKYSCKYCDHIHSWEG